MRHLLSARQRRRLSRPLPLLLILLPDGGVSRQTGDVHVHVLLQIERGVDTSINNLRPVSGRHAVRREDRFVRGGGRSARGHRTRPSEARARARGGRVYARRAEELQEPSRTRPSRSGLHREPSRMAECLPIHRALVAPPPRGGAAAGRHKPALMYDKYNGYFRSCCPRDRLARPGRLASARADVELHPQDLFDLRTSRTRWRWTAPPDVVALRPWNSARTPSCLTTFTKQSTIPVYRIVPAALRPASPRRAPPRPPPAHLKLPPAHVKRVRHRLADRARDAAARQPAHHVQVRAALEPVPPRDDVLQSAVHRSSTRRTGSRR